MKARLLAVPVALLSLAGTALPAAAATPTWSISAKVGQTMSPGVKIWSNGTATTTWSGAGRIALSAQGSQCKGSPIVEVLADGKSLGQVKIVNSTKSWQYPLAKPLGRGQHTIKVKLVNDFSARGCDRNVRIFSVGAYRDTSNPFNQAPIYAEPWYASQAKAAAAQASNRYDRAALNALASKPTATWLGPWTPRGKVGPKVAATVKAAQAKGQMPVFVIYGMYGCIGKGGSIAPKDYFSWVGEIAYNLGNSRAVVILEPDALGFAGGECSKNLPYLSGAVNALAAHKATATYIDAGHPGWLTEKTALSRLQTVGVKKVRGFSLNVANTRSDADNRRYGNSLASKLGQHYVIDTARNHHLVRGECNPAGMGVGAPPSSRPYGPLDANLWIKPPAESDGTCGGGPAAGVFWPAKAVSMVRVAGWKL